MHWPAHPLRRRPARWGLAKQDRFRIQNGGEAAVHPGRVNLGQIGYIHVSAFQTACRSDDVQPVRQRVLVPMNVIEGAVHLLVVLSRGPHAGLAEIDTEAPRLTIQPGERLTSVMAIGSQYPMARPGRTKSGGGAGHSCRGLPGLLVSGRSPLPTCTLPSDRGKMQRQHTSVIGLTNRPLTGGVCQAARPLNVENAMQIKKTWLSFVSFLPENKTEGIDFIADLFPCRVFGALHPGPHHQGQAVEEVKLATV